MMYTTFNLRPYLTSVSHALPSNEETSFFLALTYFSIVLPSFPISSTSDVNTKRAALWSRAKEVKKQVRKFGGNGSGKAEAEKIHKMWLGYWALTCARERAERARGMVKAQSTQSRNEILGTRPTKAKAKTKPVTINDVHTIWRMRHTPTSDTTAAETEGAATIDTPGKLPPAPSATLFNLSLIGNLDALYRQNQYRASPSYEAKQQLITMHNVTTACRLKPSGMLILSHTFNKKLWMHLCWDVEGFPRTPNSEVEIFWAALGDAIDTIVCMDLSKL